MLEHYFAKPSTLDKSAAADLLALYNSIDPAYLNNSSWTMNSATRGISLGLTDSTGRPLFQPALSAPNGADALGTLLGRPVVLDQYAPNMNHLILTPTS